jgi:NTP pyrophosphatase (non-canonical NTP hydrolase)
MPMTKSTNLKDLTKLVLEFRNKRNWKQFHSVSQMLLALGIEVSELSEHFLWLNEEESIFYAKKNKSSVSDELADILYWIILIANDLDINLNSALKNKINKNKKKYPINKARGKKLKYTAYQ